MMQKKSNLKEEIRKHIEKHYEIGQVFVTVGIKQKFEELKNKENRDSTDVYSRILDQLKNEGVLDNGNLASSDKLKLWWRRK